MKDELTKFYKTAKGRETAIGKWAGRWGYRTKSFYKRNSEKHYGLKIW